MAAELKREFPNAEIKLVQSTGGRFEVSRDGVPVFQKSKLKRHAESGEIVRLLRAHGSRGGAGAR